MNKNRLFLPCLYLLAGCGGGGGDASGPSTGYFVDSPVAGVGYSTATQSGLTGADGSFLYLPGEEITFTLGAVVLGGGQARATMTPFDLFPDASVPDSQQAIYSLLRQIPENSGPRIRLPEGATLEQLVPGAIQAINQLVLLQALDSDGNPENGISIESGMLELLEHTEIDFAQSPNDFHRDSELEHVVQMGVGAGLLASTRIPSPAQALAHFSAAQGVGFTAARPVAYEEDDDNDGVADKREEYEYDEDGRLVIERDDNDGDGVFDTIMNTTYAENGRILERDRGDWKMAYQYDAQDRLVRTAEDYEGDGIDDQCRFYVWGEDGKLESESRDDGCDGTAQRAEDFAYDAFGNLIRERLDSNGDGVWDRIEVYEFSDSDHPRTRTGERIDTDADGDWNFIGAVILTAAGATSVYKHDSGADGAWDYIANYFYDDAGYATGLEEDNDGDGQVDRIARYDYDALGNLMKFADDTDADGVAERIDEYAYANASYPRGVTGYTEDHDGDGVADEIDSYIYDAQGRRVREEYDGNADGVLETVEFYIYDAAGNFIEESEDRDADGDKDYILTRTYDANGMQLTESQDFDGDGVVDRVYSWEYEAGTAVNLVFELQDQAER
ncbi:hypothetical protein [Thiohalobacter sp. COW1]|uniref:hypothetical protein n=1 Tax=Thiohalobacter sp. COW1 TaxID=2795687 RepID=UPI001916A4E9|nr:hypothetical protein [Thiohalobacter sp. COW1]